ALLCTGVALWLNVWVAPAAQLKLRTSILEMATRDPMALFGSDQVIDQFPGRKIYVGKKEGNKLENIIVFELSDSMMPMRVTHARSGTLEVDLENQRILMHLHDARYQQRDERDPFDLRRMRDGINMAEGTLPISLEELYLKQKRTLSRSGMTLAQLMEQSRSGDHKEQSVSRTEINKRFSFPFSCLAFSLIAVPLGITTHRRETSMGFLISLVVALFYFLFIIAADTLRASPKMHPELLVWFPNLLFLAIGAWMFRRLARQ
ncbi:MAG: LptF/LptG family permease, partial [Verrucomicrobiota bacterium]|nr:LptF/LptG family permease [Verrucomicrobiota bacterium]